MTGYGKPYVHAVKTRIEADEHGTHMIMQDRQEAGGDDAMAEDTDGGWSGYTSKGGEFLPWPNVVSVDVVAEIRVPFTPHKGKPYSRIVTISSGGISCVELSDDCAEPHEDLHVKNLIREEREDLAELLAAFGVIPSIDAIMETANFTTSSDGRVWCTVEFAGNKYQEYSFPHDTETAREESAELRMRGTLLSTLLPID